MRWATQCSLGSVCNDCREGGSKEQGTEGPLRRPTSSVASQAQQTPWQGPSPTAAGPYNLEEKAGCWRDMTCASTGRREKVQRVSYAHIQTSQYHLRACHSRRSAVHEESLGSPKPIREGKREASPINMQEEATPAPATDHPTRAVSFRSCHMVSVCFDPKCLKGPGP